jgi:XTP/dITP diphosphohydrolase
MPEMKKIDKIVIATHNPAKIERYAKLLSPYATDILSLKEFGIHDKPKETGVTAEENAEIKGVYYSNGTGLPVFSEDEALYVDFLPDNKQPGVNVRRIDGKNEVDDDTLLSYWEDIVKNIPKDKMTGRWHIAYCFVFPDGKLKTISLDHPILFFSPSSAIRMPGWPMSSLQGSALFKKPYSELNDKEKAIIDDFTGNLLARHLADMFA